MSHSNVLHAGPLTIDLASYRLLRGGDPIRLTPTEWSLLRELVNHPSQVLTHRTLLKRVWGDEYDTELDYVHTYVSRLRRKLEPDPAHPEFILTETGIGYRFNGDSLTVAEALPTFNSGEQNRDVSPARRTVNPLPQLVGERYIGREAEREQTKTLLLDGTRLVSLYGRSGVGKTALACRVLEDLMTTQHYHGMVFLSAASTGVTLGRIISDFNRLLGTESIRDQQQTIYRVTNLLDRLNGGRYLLLLDNMEHLQNPMTNDLLDEDMSTFFKVVLEQGGTLQLLVTSRFPINLPRAVKTWERVITLEDGLTVESGVELLRYSDPDNLAGLRDASDEVLTQLVQRTHGLPRALEAVVGILLEAPILTPETLLRDTAALSTEIDDVFIEGAIQALTDDAVRMMEVVSAFERDVPVEMLTAFASDVLGMSEVQPILNRLIRAFFLKLNTNDRTVSIHPIDRTYCYDHMEPHWRQELHQQIATLYTNSFVDDGTVTSIADLSTPLGQVFHLVQARDFDAAAALLLELDREYLSIWGNYAELADLYADVRGHVSDERLQRWVVLRQGEALRRIGKLSEAIRGFEQVVGMAITAEDRLGQATALSSLGWAYYDTGQFEKAIGYWEEALTIYREIGDQYGEGDLLGGMGWVSYLMGSYEQALNHIQRSFTIFGEIGDQLYRIGMNIGDSGMIRVAQGDYEQAIRNLNESLSIAEVTNSINEKSYKGGYLAMALLVSGDFEAAEEAARIAVQYDVPANRHFVAAVHGIALARMGRRERAIRAFEDAVRYADNVLRFTSGLYNARYAHALALAGLSLLRDEPLTTALEDYGKAKAMCSTDGVVDQNLRLLAALDTDNQLSAILNLLKS
jgi:tetratricopeptide (TPR) repeat protein/DNA-binding winged helix-turn-helix (wHTH) protein